MSFNQDIGTCTYSTDVQIVTSVTQANDSSDDDNFHVLFLNIHITLTRYIRALFSQNIRD